MTISSPVFAIDSAPPELPACHEQAVDGGAASPLTLPLAFVDLETTGATATCDRITEVAIVSWDGVAARHWSSLVNPQTRIPPFIESLTGISNDMVANAPVFASLAEEIARRLAGHVFIAHNARFDYSFLKHEFKRVGIDFRAPVLCTVKYARKLYPQYRKHGLSALIERHGLQVEARHRAMGDAKAVFDFWQLTEASFPAEHLEKVRQELLAGTSLPAHIDADFAEDIPEGGGVYLFYAESGQPIHAGKSRHLRKRILAHFAPGARDARLAKMAAAVRRIEWQACAGEIDALLSEARLIRAHQPALNRQRRREVHAWVLREEADGLRPVLIGSDELEAGCRAGLYGLYKNARDARQSLRELAGANQLCLARLGLENTLPGKPCLARQHQRCTGACTGEETAHDHAMRLMQVLARIKLADWPFNGPALLREGEVVHVIDHWCHLGTARAGREVEDILCNGQPLFDLEACKLLLRHQDMLTPLG